MSDTQSIIEAACSVLLTANPAEKAARAREVAKAWNAGEMEVSSGPSPLPERPARPDKPVLTAPNNVPRRRLGSVEGRQALLHAVAHIELNAIDLAFDMIARFGLSIPANFQTDFITDWISVGDDEARHFNLIAERLAELGASYGDLPAHDGLWEAALSTQDDVLARLSIAPLVLEARGLDVTPQMIGNFEKVGDQVSAECLKIIYQEEIGHVAIGVKWLKQMSRAEGFDPKERFQHFVETRFNGKLKPPFNEKARGEAGFDVDFYINITH